MKKWISMILVCILLNIQMPVMSQEIISEEYKSKMKQDILTLMLAYPEYIKDIETDGNKTFIIMKSGKKILYDDMRKKGHEEKLDNPDLQDMLEQIYPLEFTTTVMKKDFDPGRGRNYDLLHEVYGSSKGEIEKNLKPLQYGFAGYRFNDKNGARAALETSLKELIPLAKTRPDISSCLYPASGTYNYRVISGTGRLSPHSFGIAIDLKSDPRDYWKWSTEKKAEERLKSYSKDLVQVFEKNNFVWGGKWGHFDILHFEYRPEIMIKAKYFGGWKESDGSWYKGAPVDNEEVKKAIELIEDRLEDNKEQTTLSEAADKELVEFVQDIFINRNKAILDKNLELIESLYDTNSKYGKWAYEYEERKVKYLNNWAEKQGVKFTEIIPKVIIRRSRGGNDKYSFNIMCNTEYKYIYENLPDIVNSSRIGTYHSLQLTKQEGEWVITKEWYTDPFADSLSLDNIKAESIKQHIISQETRDISDINERRKGAMQYADMFCGAASLPEYGFKYNKNYRDFNPEGGDCANFASQVLNEGGKFKKNSTWNYNKGSATGPWVNADKFTSYMIYSGRASVIAHGSYEKVYKASYKLLPGDFVAYEKKGDITHISVVSGVDSKGYTLVTCHNTDRNNVPWDLGWSDKKINFWLVRVHY